MPPIPRPFPTLHRRPPQESKPYGRWEERLSEEFAEACAAARRGGGGAARPARRSTGFPSAWGGRVYVPATGRAAEGEPASRRRRASDGRADRVLRLGLVRAPRRTASPRDLRARADFTDVTAEDNPDWKIDLSDDVIGNWRAEGDRGGDITLVWGLPLVRGAIAATAELDGEVIDQAAVHEGRFTLVAVDAVTRLRRRPLPGGQAVEPDAAPDRVREPVRGVRRRLSRDGTSQFRG